MTRRGYAPPHREFLGGLRPPNPRLGHPRRTESFSGACGPKPLPPHLLIRRYATAGSLCAASWRST
ncbi:MAG: hypothetical protein RLZZ387_5139 [Chloroflexota bacterium]|jgi:hypothetical protein